MARWSSRLAASTMWSALMVTFATGTSLGQVCWTAAAPWRGRAGGSEPAVDVTDDGGDVDAGVRGGVTAALEVGGGLPGGGRRVGGVTGGRPGGELVRIGGQLVAGGSGEALRARQVQPLLERHLEAVGAGGCLGQLLLQGGVLGGEPLTVGLVAVRQLLQLLLDVGELAFGVAPRLALLVE